MFVWLGTDKRARRVRGGREERAYCPECDVETRFVEVEIEEKITLFSVIDLFDDTQRAFHCTGCGALGTLAEGELPAGVLEDLSPEAAERLERVRHAERLGRLEAERARRAGEQRARELRAGEELVALKRRMGLVAPADEAGVDGNAEPEPRSSAAGARRWWQRRRR
jgi:hypothetical protein